MFSTPILHAPLSSVVRCLPSSLAKSSDVDVQHEPIRDFVSFYSNMISPGAGESSRTERVSKGSQNATRTYIRDYSMGYAFTHSCMGGWGHLQKSISSRKDVMLLKEASYKRFCEVADFAVSIPVNSSLLFHLPPVFLAILLCILFKKKSGKEKKLLENEVEEVVTSVMGRLGGQLSDGESNLFTLYYRTVIALEHTYQHDTVKVMMRYLRTSADETVRHGVSQRDDRSSSWQMPSNGSGRLRAVNKQQHISDNNRSGVYSPRKQFGKLSASGRAQIANSRSYSGWRRGPQCEWPQVMTQKLKSAKFGEAYDKQNELTLDASKISEATSSCFSACLLDILSSMKIADSSEIRGLLVTADASMEVLKGIAQILISGGSIANTCLLWETGGQGIAGYREPVAESMVLSMVDACNELLDSVLDNEEEQGNYFAAEKKVCELIHDMCSFSAIGKVLRVNKSEVDDTWKEKYGDSNFVYHGNIFHRELTNLALDKSHHEIPLYPRRIRNNRRKRIVIVEDSDEESSGDNENGKDRSHNNRYEDVPITDEREKEDEIEEAGDLIKGAKRVARTSISRSSTKKKKHILKCAAGTRCKLDGIIQEGSGHNCATCRSTMHNICRYLAEKDKDPGDQPFYCSRACSDSNQKK